MGIFSWLFSKDTEKSSHIRKWIVEEREKISAQDQDGYAMFIRFMDVTVKWGKEEAQGGNKEQQESARLYMGDATLLEIADYTYWRLSAWMKANHPYLATELLAPLNKFLTEKFYTTLYLDGELVQSVLQERLAAYEAAGVPAYTQAQQYILCSRGNKFNNREKPTAPQEEEYISGALTIYEQALNEYFSALEEHYQHSGRAQAAAEQQEKAVQELQGDRDYVFGMALVAQQDWVRAAKVFTKILEKEENHYQARLQRGMAYVKMQNPMAAEKDFTKAIAAAPSQAEAYLQRARCYHRFFRQGDPAVADYNEAVKLAPENATGYFWRGELFDEVSANQEQAAVEKGDTAAAAQLSEGFLAALRDYDQAIALDGNNDEFYAKRGLLYTRKARATGNTDFMQRAVADLDKAMKMNRTNGYLYKAHDEMQEKLEKLGAESPQ